MQNYGVSRVDKYILGVKKKAILHSTLAHNFARCGPIIKILRPVDWALNVQ